MVRVLLVDDHQVVRAGLKSLLETSGMVEVVGEASSGREAVAKARTLEPDIVIMDLAMPGMDGIQATQRITDLELGTKILVLTVHDEDDYLVPALEAGAVAYLDKSVADTGLIGAIEALARGHSYLPQRAAKLLAARKVKRTSDDGPDPGVLSPRELCAIEFYARGYSTRESADEMDLSPKTVEGYLGRAKTKLGLYNRRDLVRFAITTGLLQADED